MVIPLSLSLQIHMIKEYRKFLAPPSASDFDIQSTLIPLLLLIYFLRVYANNPNSSYITLFPWILYHFNDEVSVNIAVFEDFLLQH